MQTINLSSNRTNGQLLDTRTPLRLRAFRFLSERYLQHEPNYAAEFVVFALIILTATWPLFTLAHVISLSR